MNSTMQLVMIGLVTLIATDLVSYSFARMVPESCGYLPPNQPYRQLIHSGTKGGYATGGQWPWMAFVSYKERECDRRIGKEEKGGGISVKDMPAEDVVACENACKKELRCTRFKFDKILRHCWLKKAFFYPPSIFETNWDVISGTCGNYYYDCGGAIIDREWILTAGHCLRSEKASDFCVVVGHKDKFDLHYENCTPLGRRPLQVIRHPIYNQTALVGTSLRDLSEKQWKIRYHDIGLIKMAPIPFATPNVGRICLPTEAGDYHDRSCYVAGWGDTETGRTSEYLKTLRSRIWSKFDCRHKSMFGRRLNHVDNYYCFGEEGANVCQGDSGGPLFCQRSNGQFEVVGVSSTSTWGENCTGLHIRVFGMASYFVRVPTFIEWIKDTIAANKYSKSSSLNIAEWIHGGNQ